MNVLMAILLLAIAFLLFVDGWITGPILQRLGITPVARGAVALFFISMGTYMAWIGYLFARDQLEHGQNYHWQLVLIRVGVLIGLLGLTQQAWENRLTDETQQ